ncbi:SDR family NAD(P)-dependent oxidoreductase [Streptomyces sp. B21-083]|uniref:SDR family NAD(P)-dependent oxidoreductase n=1 Tax=Streptomyces sp. B21-083 TaxID=3039410 RepID=UPI002FF34C70
MRIFLCTRDADAVAATVKLLHEEGVDADGQTCDVRSTEQVEAFVRAAVDRYGPIDVLARPGIRRGSSVAARRAPQCSVTVNVFVDAATGPHSRSLVTSGSRVHCKRY